MLRDLIRADDLCALLVHLIGGTAGSSSRGGDEQGTTASGTGARGQDGGQHDCAGCQEQDQEVHMVWDMAAACFLPVRYPCDGQQAGGQGKDASTSVKSGACVTVCP